MSEALTIEPAQIIGLDGTPLRTLPPHKVVFSEESEAKEMAWAALGELDDIEFAFNDVLVLKYIRADISPNLKASAETQRKDRWQGSIGLVLKVGPRAFVDDPANNVYFHGFSVKRGDWVMYRSSDGWDRGLQELYGFHRFADCRIIQDAHIRARIKYPGRFMALGGV